MMRDGLGALRFPIREPIQHGHNNQPTTRIQHYSGLLFLPSVMHASSSTQMPAPVSQTTQSVPQGGTQSLLGRLTAFLNSSQESAPLPQNGNNTSANRSDSSQKSDEKPKDTNSRSPEQKKTRSTCSDCDRDRKSFKLNIQKIGKFSWVF